MEAVGLGQGKRGQFTCRGCAIKCEPAIRFVAVQPHRLTFVLLLWREGRVRQAAASFAEEPGLNSKPTEIVLVGSNTTRLWGMTVDERTRRIARKQKLEIGDDGGSSAALLVNRAFVFDPAWLRYFSRRPGEALTLEGTLAIAHCRDGRERASVAKAMENDTALPADSGIVFHPHEKGDASVNAELRKREQPFLMRLRPDTVPAAERASYFGAYKGVTDLLTKYLWPEWALVLTRMAARFGISPNMVTVVGMLMCVLATFLFWHGQYWAGMAAGFVFMVLDTVDGKLARCTITSSRLGNILDHGVDLVHPPFWWWAWSVGLTAYGHPIETDYERLLLALIVGGYVLQRLIEGAFMRSFRMHIHVWRRLDSRFRLITARRNPNMVILFVSMLFGRPDLGFIALAWWTVLSCLFHLIRLFQAVAHRASGGEIRSWLY